MPVTPIARRTLHDELTGLLRDLILQGELRPGAKVPERELCERFAVSRTPMREAMKVLAAEGLFQLLPNRGAIVAAITAEEVDDLFPIMGALEALAGERAAKQIGDAGIAAIRGLHEEMLSQHRRGDWLAYIKLNRAIHEAIFAAAGNRTLTQLYHALMARIHAVRFVEGRDERAWRQAVDDHTAIIDAIEARDGARLGALLREHLAHKADMVRASLRPAAGSAAAE